MNYRILYITILLLLSTTVTVHAQNIYDGQVIDKTTELAIPGVTVSLQKTNKATQTSEQGYFKITADTEIESDTLIFSFVGYKTLKLGVKDSQQQILVALEPSVNQLKQVEINGNKAQDKVLSKFSWSDLKEVNTSFYKHFTHSFSAETSFAKLFEAPQANVRLINIRLGRREYSSSTGTPYSTASKYAHFFVHICAIDSITNTPGRILLTKDLVLLDNAMMITLDLSKERVIIPDNKFYIVIDWMQIPFNEVIAMNYTAKTERAKLNGKAFNRGVSSYWIFYQPFLVAYPTNEPKSVKWIKQHGGWDVMTYYPDCEIALSATIRY